MLIKGMVRNIAVAVTILALLVLPACQPAAVPVTGMVITITAQDYSFAVPESVNSGFTTLVLDNKGQEPHHAQMLRLNEGVTLDQVNAALMKGEEGIGELLSLTAAVGGPGVVPSQGKSQVILDLEPGQHVLVCFVSSEDGAPHVAKGMVKAFTVTDAGAQAQAAEPKADQTVTMKDFAFEMPTQVKAGPQTWKIVNSGPQIHELAVVKLSPGTTFQDLQAMLTSDTPMSGPPPWTDAGGMQALSQGLTGWLSLDLEPGEYAAFCFVPDPASMKAHFELGMMSGFTVQ
jgi:hypothetical protein